MAKTTDKTWHFEQWRHLQFANSKRRRNTSPLGTKVRGHNGHQPFSGELWSDWHSYHVSGDQLCDRRRSAYVNILSSAAAPRAASSGQVFFTPTDFFFSRDACAPPVDLLFLHACDVDPQPLRHARLLSVSLIFHTGGVDPDGPATLAASRNFGSFRLSFLDRSLFFTI